LMITQFINHSTFWKINILQAFIFSIWHLVWPIKNFYMGKAVSIENLAVMSSGYIIISFLMGLTMGYIFYKTGNLWIAFVWHFFNDLTQNLLVVRNGNPSIEPAILNTSSALVKGLSFILLFIIINVSLKYFISFKVN